MATITTDHEESERIAKRALALLLALKEKMSAQDAVGALCCALQMMHINADAEFRAGIRATVHLLGKALEAYEHGKRE